MSRTLICVVMALLLAAAPLPAAQPPALGVVLEAERAQIGSGAASPGSSIYDGDALTTSAQGGLRLRAGKSLIYLGPQSSLTLHRTANGTAAELGSGTVVFSGSREAAMEISVSGAQLKPVSSGPVMAQVSIAGPKILDVTARRGALEFTYAGESEVIPEGASYRVVLDPPEQGPAGVSSKQGEQPKKTGRRRKGFLFLIIGAVGLATWVAVDEALESPDRP